MKNSTSRLIIGISTALAIASVAIIVGASMRAAAPSDIWYSSDPSVVTVDQELGTMKAIYKGTTLVCERFAAGGEQCFNVTVR